MTSKRIIKLAAFLIILVNRPMQAWFWNDNCCDYLLPCSYNIQVQAGVNPIVWTDRSDECCIDDAHLPSFKHLFKLPWVVGAKLGSNITECSEIYVEGIYTQAKGKRCDGFTVTCPQSVNGTATITSELSKYKAFAFYIGSRYYFSNNCLSQCSCFDRAAFFIGMQVGFVHHKRVEVTLASTSLVGNSGPFVRTMFLKNNTISAGGNFGLDLAFNDCFSLVFTVEIVGNGAAQNCPIACLANTLPGINANTIVTGRYGTEIWFPITAGIKYTF